MSVAFEILTAEALRSRRKPSTFSPAPTEVQQKHAPLPVDAGAGTRGDGFAQRLRQRGFRVPDDTVGEVRRMTRRQGLRGTPKGHDIVIGLAPGRYFDQFDGARAPFTLGFDPGAGRRSYWASKS